MNAPTCAPWPNFSQVEGKLVEEVLLSNKVNYWTGGRGKSFEHAFSKATNSRYSIALANGTLALDLALQALGVGSGDEVIVTPRSFMASASSVCNCGATPVFADVDAQSQNVTVETVNAVITPKTKAILCVHLAGWPCDMVGLMNLAASRGVFVIEDCAQAHGATVNGQSVGSFGDVGAWSFCQDKIMTTGGEGGMVTTNRDSLFEDMWAYKDHGKSRQKMENPPANRSFKYVHDSFGTNFRMTEMQAALGEYQLTQLASWTQERTANAAFYNDKFADLEAVRTALPPENMTHAYYKYYCFLNLEQLKKGWDRDRIVEAMHDSGGHCFSGCCPEIYREEAYVARFGKHPTLPVAHQLGKESLMFNINPGISREYLQHNVSVFHNIMELATE